MESIELIKHSLVLIREFIRLSERSGIRFIGEVSGGSISDILRKNFGIWIDHKFE